jgi:hypothetical protein
VTFDGNVIELANVAVPVPRERLRLAVRPRRAVRGDQTRFRFRATVARDGKRVAVAGVRVRFAHQVVSTNASGRAAITATLTRRGKHRARARHFDFRRDRALVRVRPGR